MWHRPRGSFKLYKESIIVLAFLINFRIPPNLDQLNITSAILFFLDTIRISLLHSKYPISYNKKSIFFIFAIYRSKVNTSLKNKVCFENMYFPSKFIKLCPESLKEHTDKISLSSDETQTFY